MCVCVCVHTHTHTHTHTRCRHGEHQSDDGARQVGVKHALKHGELGLVALGGVGLLDRILDAVLSDMHMHVCIPCT